MKTFADVKRRATLGTVLTVVWHRLGHKLVNKPRKIQIVQTNAIAFEPLPGHDKPSWLFWPPAREVKITGPDTFDVLDEDGNLLISYRFG